MNVRNGLPRRQRSAFSSHIPALTNQRSRGYDIDTTPSQPPSRPCSLATVLSQFARYLVSVEVPVGGIAECAARASHRRPRPLRAAELRRRARIINDDIAGGGPMSETPRGSSAVTQDAEHGSSHGIVAVHGVRYQVKDVARAVAFYTGKLGSG